MPAQNLLSTALDEWRTVLGPDPVLGDEAAGRELWPVVAKDGTRYVLKRLGPWRNLPLADEARVLRHLAGRGVGVAEYLPTDRAKLYAGAIEDSFVLMPRLANDPFGVAEVLALEPSIGAALANLHLALATYPRAVNSYTEHLDQSLARDLMLPPDIAGAFAGQRRQLVEQLADLPLQLIHGDLTPENVLLRRPGVVSGFIDFDHLPMAPRVWDIAKYLSRRIRLRWRDGPAGTGRRLDHLPGFLNGYHRTNPLTPAEIAALPSAIAAGNLLEVSYFLEISAGTLPRRRLSDHDEVLADTVEAARWQLANHAAVVALVGSALA